MSLVAVASNPFDRYKGIEKPEEKKTIASVDSKLEGILAKAEYYLDNAVTPRSHPKWYTEILTPEEISKFVQCLLRLEKHWRFMFVSSRAIIDLVQNSYDAGYNEFDLNISTFTLPPYNLCKDLQGTKERPLEVTIRGDCWYVGADSEYVEYKIRGDVKDVIGFIGLGATNCTFVLYNRSNYERAIERSNSTVVPTGNRIILIGPEGTKIQEETL